MVQAMIDIKKEANKVLNIVKAKYGLKDKSEAINLGVKEYEENFLEPELRPEYKNKLLKIIKGKHTLTYTVVGYALLLLTTGIIRIIENLLKVQK